MNKGIFSMDISTKIYDIARSYTSANGYINPSQRLKLIGDKTNTKIIVTQPPHLLFKE